MEKKSFIFEFPRTKSTITVEASPLCVKDMAIKYLQNQGAVFGDLCIIRRGEDEDTLAIACWSSEMGDLKFFTEDDSLSDIREMEEIIK